MKNNRYNRTVMALLCGVGILAFSSCEREFSDQVEFATFPANGDVFIDAFSAGLDYFPFVDGGADPEAFSVETTEVFEGAAAMRFDVPAFGNGFVGAAFNTTANRDLSGFDALTFYAKASQTATINEIGFGIDGNTANQFQVTRQNVAVSTRWEKYVIPIPDPSKLHNQTGLFWLAEGARNETDEGGYVLWLDEVRFEKLGTIAQANPAILDGTDISQQAFVGIPIQLSGLTQTFNLGSGDNVTVIAKPSYFSFKTSNRDVATVNERGMVNVIGTGEATISAQLGNVGARGSLSLNVSGSFDFPPSPPQRNPADVISVFSNAYNNIAVDYLNGFFNGDGQTTQGGAPPLDLNGDNIINYTDLNFVGIGFFNNVPTVNATEMTTIHIDLKVNEAISPGDFIRIQLLNDVGGNETSGAVTLNADALVQDQWIRLDLPLADFTGLVDRSKLGLLFFVSDATVADIFVDNIYFYK